MSNKSSTQYEVPTMAHRDDLICKIQAVLRSYHSRKPVLASDISGAGMKNKPNAILQSENSKVMVHHYTGN